MAMKRFFLVALFLLFAPPASASECHDHTAIGVPSQAPQLLCREGYALSHDGNLKIPIWVQYRLTAQKARGGGVGERSNDFRADTELYEGGRSELEDYRGSGYDRGHIAPAADMKWSAKAMSESFLLSNMAPQVGKGFNRGIWSKLEARVRSWAIDRGEVYVISGPIFTKGAEHYNETIGPDHVAVPTHFYKIVYDPLRKEAIAFVLPNHESKAKDLPDYRVSIAAIEKKTGLDFLNRLDKKEEKRIEEGVMEMWEK